jgi:hypothetical protein
LEVTWPNSEVPRKVATGECIGNTHFFAAGTCSTGAGGDFKFTEGPIPAAGGSISNLEAEAGTAVNATVNVIDKTPSGAQTVVMTCMVTGGTKTCSNTGTVGIVALHYLMVRIETTSTATTWRVSFRY